MKKAAASAMNAATVIAISVGQSPNTCLLGERLTCLGPSLPNGVSGGKTHRRLAAVTCFPNTGLAGNRITELSWGGTWRCDPGPGRGELPLADVGAIEYNVVGHVFSCFSPGRENLGYC